MLWMGLKLKVGVMEVLGSGYLGDIRLGFNAPSVRSGSDSEILGGRDLCPALSEGVAYLRAKFL